MEEVKKGQISTSVIRTGHCKRITSLHSLSLFTNYDGSLKKSAVGSSCYCKLKIMHSFYYFGFHCWLGLSLPNGAKLSYSLLSEQNIP